MMIFFIFFYSTLLALNKYFVHTYRTRLEINVPKRAHRNLYKSRVLRTLKTLQVLQLTHYDAIKCYVYTKITI